MLRWLLERQFGMTAQQDVRLSGAGDGQIKITEVIFDYTAADNSEGAHAGDVPIEAPAPWRSGQPPVMATLGGRG